MISEETVQLLESRKTEYRIRAIQRLAREPGNAAQPYLLKALKDKSNYVAALAARALGECADLGAAAVMIERFHWLSEDGLRRDPGCHIRAHLAFAFGRLELLHADDAARIGIRTVQIEPVGGVPYDTAAHLRANCALALAQIQARDALRDITLLLFDDGAGRFGAGDPTLKYVEPRKVAARALGMLSIPEARVPLTLRLTYPHGEAPEVLQQCMQSLVQLEDPDCADVLMPYAQSDDAELAVFAGLMLAKAEAPAAEDVLLEMICRFHGGALEAALLALSSVRSDKAKQALLELASEGTKEVKDAIKALGLARE